MSEPADPTPEEGPPLTGPGSRARSVAEAVALILVFVLAAIESEPPTVERWVLLLLGAFQVLPLLVRRRFPGAVFAVTATALVAEAAVPPVGVYLSCVVVFPLGVYSVAKYERRRWVRGASIAGCAAVAVSFGWPPRFEPEDLPISWAVFAMVAGFCVCMVAWFAGDHGRRRQLVLSALAAQNESLRRAQSQQSELAAQAERVRIAREMHDVVAHSLAVVVVQADGAVFAAENSPDWTAQDSRQALSTIAATARQALRETRSLVSVLRADGEAPLPCAPGDGLGELETLLDRFRGAGLPVHVEGAETIRLPTELDLAVFRIIQESLTNVLKHAGEQAMARVLFEHDQDGVQVTVEDDGDGAVAVVEGNGLIGMRERAASVGGLLDVGPRPGGGLRVRLWVPRTPASPPGPADLQ